MPIFPLALAAFVAMAPSVEQRRSPATPLTFDQRVEAQRAIERVYWQHRIWPAENPGSKPPLEKVLSGDVLRARVTRSLKLSNALAAVWGRPVDGPQLQAELRRMTTSSRSPDVLRELFDALGGDPHVIAEMLARPVLVERLARNYYAGDDRFHGALRRQAEAVAVGKLALANAGGTYHEERWSIGSEGTSPTPIKGVMPVVVSRDAWTSTLERLSGRVLEEDEGSIRVRELLARDGDVFTVGIVVWDKVPFETWFDGRSKDLATALAEPTYHYVLLNPSKACVPDTWRPTRTGVPDGRRDHAVIWTGTEMIVWGGISGSFLMNSGGRYDPATDTWKALSKGPGTPSPRSGHTGVWTGTEMIVWGGRDDSGPLGDGGVYEPTTDTWQPVAAALGSPAARSGHTAVWTGHDMIVWGGEEAQGCGSDGGRYDAASKDWFPVSPVGPTARCRHTAVWTGNRMIVWGGWTPQNAPLATGGSYDPTTDKWVPTSTGADTPAPRGSHSAVWTGTEMIVYGGGTPVFEDTQLTSISGSRFDPVKNAWTRIPDDIGRAHQAAVWTGKEMILWGGALQYPPQYGSRYDPSTNVWAPTAPRFGNLNAPAVWTGSEMIVWAGELNNNEGGRYTPATDSWIPTSNSPEVPVSRFAHTMVWTGAEMILWGGYSPANGGVLSSGKRYDPAIDDWKHVPDTEPPRYYHSAVWTGTEMIVWGGFSWFDYENSGARYDPTADTWTPTGTGIGVPSPRTFHHAFWTGTEMLIWAGAGSQPTNTGGLYDPLTDGWRTTSIANVPFPADLLAVWTGHEMIAWGGYRRRAGEPVQITGGRYDPASNTWTSVAEDANTPIARIDGTAVWTGREMLVWGGLSLPDQAVLNSGGRYDPLLDQWLPTSSTGMLPPPRRHAHTAVWTGTEMLVWGGEGLNGELQDGFRYDPASSKWSATSIGADVPPARTGHLAVWTGNEMIVWGDAFGWTAIGGCYCGLPVPDVPDSGSLPRGTKARFAPRR